VSANEQTTFRLTILTPEREVYAGDVERVTATGLGSVFEILPGHEPLLAPLEVGLLAAREPGGSQEKLFALHAGFLEVTNDGALLLADGAESETDVDIDRARRAVQRARERLGGQTDLPEDFNTDRARDALLRGLARISAVEKDAFL